MAEALLRAAGALGGTVGGGSRKGGGELSLWVRIGPAAPVAVEVPFDATVADLRLEIGKLPGVEATGAPLSFAGRELGPADEGTPLADLGIGNEATVELSMKRLLTWEQHHEDIVISEDGLKAQRTADSQRNCVALGPELRGAAASFSLMFDNYAGLVGVACSTEMTLDEHMGSVATRGSSWILQTYADHASRALPPAAAAGAGRGSMRVDWGDPGQAWQPDRDVLHVSVDFERSTVQFHRSTGVDGKREFLCEYTHPIKRPLHPAIGLYNANSYAKFV
eukprot:TRINITY_DN47408_c0_g1_i1.p1 TRINITY_DN47408_c0_g1~~TRINITY_DN47408_c0_g1_i1.p1  ORF type:complete len:302 (+),score=93.68 TRINITY_DN47408_c0_g1_i1:72-908(+)